MKKFYKYLTLIIGLIICFCACFVVSPKTIEVSAGASKVYIASSVSVVGSSINEGDFLVDGGIKAKDSKVIFNESTAKNAKLLAKTKVNNYKEYGVTRLLEMNFTISIANIVENGKFAVAIGLNRSRDTVGSADSMEIVFTYNSQKEDLFIGVNEYVQEGSAKTISTNAAYPLFPLNADITFNINIDVDSKLYISATPEGASSATDIVRGRTLTTDPTGYVAFVSESTDEGKNVCTISNMAITAYAYDVVETVDHYLETFDNNAYNANMFYSTSSAGALAPSKIYVDNGQLIFKNMGPGYFTTRERYSNFELKFDITYLAREGLMDDDGNIIQLISNWFMIGFGVDNYDDPASERINATFLQFEGLPISSQTNPSNHFTGEVPAQGNRYVLWNNGSAANVRSMEMYDGKHWSIFDKSIGEEVINLKLTVVDGVITLWFKRASDSEYGDPQYEYDLGNTQTGYVRIYSYGDSYISQQGYEYTAVLNMAIDNFEISNLDNEAVKLVKPAPEFKSNVVAPTPDFNYTTVTDDSDLLNNKLKK